MTMLACCMRTCITYRTYVYFTYMRLTVLMLAALPASLTMACPFQSSPPCMLLRPGLWTRFCRTSMYIHIPYPTTSSTSTGSVVGIQSSDRAVRMQANRVEYIHCYAQRIAGNSRSSNPLCAAQPNAYNNAVMQQQQQQQQSDDDIPFPRRRRRRLCATTLVTRPLLCSPPRCIAIFPIRG